MRKILAGTASWTDRSLLESGWYPEDASTPAKRLAYYASRFPLVEVDATYYHPPAQRTVEAWRDRTPPDFTFDVKAFSLLTGHPTRPESLYRDLREKLGTSKRNLYLDDVDPEIVEEVWQRFLSALRPLHEAGKLGAVLFQFPPWFPIGEGRRRYILECARRCRPMRVSVEFRNHTWMEEESREETLRFLAANDIAYVCVDMPQGHPSSIPPILPPPPTSSWYGSTGTPTGGPARRSRNASAYLYSEAELKRWAVAVRRLAEDAKVAHVLFNNCCEDSSQRNAARFLTLVDELDGERDPG